MKYILYDKGKTLYTLYLIKIILKKIKPCAPVCASVRACARR
jgi:hypothetical protein